MPRRQYISNECAEYDYFLGYVWLTNILVIMIIILLNTFVRYIISDCLLIFIDRNIHMWRKNMYMIIML